MTVYRALKVALGVISVLALYIGGTQALYAHRLMPGIHVGNVDVGGKTTEQAQAILDQRVSGLNQLSYVKEDRKIPLTAQEIGLAVDTKATLQEARGYGRHNLLDRVSYPLHLLSGNTAESPLHYTLVESALRDKLAATTKDLASPAKNATIVREGRDFRIMPEEAGSIVDPAVNVQAARRAVESFQSTIPLYIRQQQPEIRAADLGATKAYAEQLAASPLTVTAAGKSFKANEATVASWVAFEPRLQTGIQVPLLQANLLSQVDRSFGVGTDNAPIIRGDYKTLYAVADVTKIGEYIASIADGVDQPPENARLAFVNNQLTVEGQAGWCSAQSPGGGESAGFQFKASRPYRSAAHHQQKS